jgi:Glycosyltransferase family 20
LQEDCVCAPHGIIERLRAIELLLEGRPELRGRVAFVQIAVPSRGEIREYRALRRNIEELVGRINGRFTDPGGDVPVHYLYRGIRRERLLAYYRLADVCLVTPLADGMNPVAKEFVTAQAACGGSGALVLSEFTGAAVELREALPCNPFDVAGLADTIEHALELDEGRPRPPDRAHAGHRGAPRRVLVDRAGARGGRRSAHGGVTAGPSVTSCLGPHGFRFRRGDVRLLGKHARLRRRHILFFLRHRPRAPPAPAPGAHVLDPTLGSTSQPLSSLA